MAVVQTPLAYNVIRTFRGSLDFYYWKGLGVCRKWPRRAQQPNSPAQLTARANFRRMINILKALPVEWHDTWKTVSLPHGRSVTDLKRKHVLWLLHANRWSEPPVVLGKIYQHQPGSPTATILITHRPFAEPADATKCRWLYAQTDTVGQMMSYEEYLPAKTREHYYYYQTKPTIAEYSLPITQTYDATALRWTLTIPPTTSPISLMARPEILP